MRLNIQWRLAIWANLYMLINSTITFKTIGSHFKELGEFRFHISQEV